MGFFVEVWIGWVCGILWRDVVGKFEITWGLLDQEWFLVGREGIFFGDFKKSSWNFWGDIFYLGKNRVGWFLSVRKGLA